MLLLLLLLLLVQLVFGLLLGGAAPRKGDRWYRKAVSKVLEL